MNPPTPKSTYLEERWRENAAAFVAFVAEHDQFPSEDNADDPAEAHLARWRRNQVALKELLSDERRAVLDAIGGFFDHHGPASDWDPCLERSMRHRAAHDGRPPRRRRKGKDEDAVLERRAARWERDQKTAYRAGRLTDEQVARLKDAGIL